MLEEIHELLPAHLDFDELVRRLYQFINLRIQARVFYVALYEPTQRQLHFKRVMVDQKLTAWEYVGALEHVAKVVMRQGKPILILPDQPSPLKDLGITPGVLETMFPWGMTLPLIASDGQVFGVIGLLDDRPEFLIDDNHQRFLQFTLQQAGQILHTSLGREQSRRMVQDLSLITMSMQDEILTLDRRESLRRVCELAARIANADNVVLVITQRNSSDLMHLADVGLTTSQREFLAQNAHILHEHTHEIETLPHWNTPDKRPHLRQIAEGLGFHALTLIPLQTHSARIAWLVVGYYQPHMANRTEIDLLGTVTGYLSSIIDNSELFEALEGYALEMAQLAHLARITASQLDIDAVMQDVAETMRQMTNMRHATVLLLQGDDLTWEEVYNAHEVVNFKGPSIAALWNQIPELRDWLQQPNHGMAMFYTQRVLSDELRAFMVAKEEQALFIVPLMMQQHCIGALVLGASGQRTLTDRERQLIEMATHQIAMHVYNARLYSASRQALKQRLEQLTVIEEIARRISSSFDFVTIVRYMLDAALRGTGANYVAIALLSEHDTFRTLYRNDDLGDYQRLEVNIPLSYGIIGEVARSGRPLRVMDNRQLEEYQAPRHAQYVFQSSLAVPLLRGEEVIGVLNVESIRPAFFREEHLSFLSNLAGHTVISIDNAQLLEERQYQVRVLAQLQTLAIQLTRVVDSRPVADAILESAMQLFNCDQAALFHHDADSGRLVLFASIPNVSPRLSVQMAREAAQTGEMQILQMPQIRADGAIDMEMSDLGSILNIPLMRTGRVQEVLALAFEERRSFLVRDLDTITLFASQAAGHLENAHLHEQIRAGNQRLTAILNTTRDAVILIDDQGVLVEANPAALRLLGRKLMPYVEDLALQFMLPYRGMEQEQALFPGEGHTPRPPHRRRFDYETPQGVIYLEEVGTPVYDPQSGLNGWLMVLRDVTEDKLLTQHREEITSMVIHDLRGPLASIITGIEFALEELANQDNPLVTVEKTLSLSSQNAVRLMQQVETMLDIARLEAREMPLNQELWPLQGVLDDALTSLEPLGQRYRITIDRSIPPDLPHLMIDPPLIRRVLMNLVDNALRHTPEGGHVLVQAQFVSSTTVLIRVADSGPGLPPEERERIFEKFRQARKNQARGRGMGLGLTFCRLVIEAHGGRIWVEDHSPLHGASFAFTLIGAQRNPG